MIAFQNSSLREYWPIILAGAILFVASLFLLPITDSYRSALEMCRQTLLCSESGTCGPSGALYTPRHCFRIRTVNGLSIDPANKRLRLFSENKVTRAWAIVNLFTIVVLVLYLGFDTALFLSESQGVKCICARSRIRRWIFCDLRL
jgi:hypothetical protein